MKASEVLILSQTLITVSEEIGVRDQAVAHDFIRRVPWFGPVLPK